MKNQNGQAAILIVFVLCMTSVFIGISLVQTGFVESLMGRANPLSAKAFYIANSGVEEALYQLNKDANYGSTPIPPLLMSEGQANVRVYKDDDQTDVQRTIESAGKSGLYIRKIKVKTEQTSGFDYAIEAGDGGFDLKNNTQVNGNVYSNSYVKGKIDNCGGGGASMINGNAWAVQTISGVCITGDRNPSASPITLPVPIEDIQTLKDHVEQIKIFTQTCDPDGSNNINDCTFGIKDVDGSTPVLGNIKIEGDLNVNNSINFSGPVWVTGQLKFQSKAQIGLTDAIYNNPEKLGQIVVVDEEIIVDTPNVVFIEKNGIFLLFISTSSTKCSKDGAAIWIKNNTENVLFYAKYGCVQINSNVDFNGAIFGDSINMEAESTVDFNSGLSHAKFSLTDTLNLTNTGPWEMVSFKEE